jgi:hypothetical protein
MSKLLPTAGRQSSKEIQISNIKVFTGKVSILSNFDIHLTFEL